MELVHHIRACSNTEIAGFADVYSRRLETASSIAPGASIHLDYRGLLDDPSVDAVVIATPEHLHAEQFCDVARGRQACVSRKDDGVQRRSREGDAGGVSKATAAVTWSRSGTRLAPPAM